MGQGIGEDAEERLILRLAVEPLQRISVDKLRRVLFPSLVSSPLSHGRGVGGEARIPNVLLHHLCHEMRVAPALGVVTVQEVGIVGMCLELTDGTVEAVNAAEVGQRAGRTLAALAGVRIAVGQCGVGIGIVVVPISAGPFAEHARAVAFRLEELGDDGMRHVVGFLPDDVIVGILAEHILSERAAPVLAVAANLGVPRVLARHEGAAAGRTDGTSGVGLREAHPFLRHAVDAGRADETLSVASQVTVAHVVTHYIYNIGVRFGICSHKGQEESRDPSHPTEGKL